MEGKSCNYLGSIVKYMKWIISWRDDEIYSWEWIKEGKERKRKTLLELLFSVWRRWNECICFWGEPLFWPK